MSKKNKILCIDDEQDIVDALFRLFRKDYEVLTATSGSMALNLIKEHRFAAIISDQKMPEMNGVETLKKSIEIDPDCIRILLTGYTDIESVIESINSGEVYRYITKPWDPVDLVNTVHRCVEKYEIKNELKIKTQQLEKAFQELKTLDQAKTQFMFLINHELKTPLTVLTSYTDLLKETQLNEEQDMFLGKIQKSNDKLALIVNESLDLLKAETGQLELNNKQVEINKIIEQLSQCFEQKLKSKELILNINNKSKAQLQTDEVILNSVLTRLLDNAIKFADNKTKVHIDVCDNDGQVEFKIANTGAPVKPDVLTQILKPFHLNEEMMNHSTGLGMGLSLTQAYLKNINSQLIIKSQDKLFTASFNI